MKRTGSPVGQTVVDAIPRELLRGCSGKNKVTLQTRVHNLYDNLLVGEADDETVLGGVVLVLRLGDETLASVVVRLPFTPPTVLDLETGEVRVRLLLLDERHLLVELVV